VHQARSTFARGRDGDRPPGRAGVGDAPRIPGQRRPEVSGKRLPGARGRGAAEAAHRPLQPRDSATSREVDRPTDIAIMKVGAEASTGGALPRGRSSVRLSPMMAPSKRTRVMVQTDGNSGADTAGPSAHDAVLTVSHRNPAVPQIAGDPLKCS